MTTLTKEQSAAALAGNHGFSLISDEKLRQFYATMLQCRLNVERAQARGPRNSFAGLEAATVGVLIDLLPDDTVAAAPGDLIVRSILGEPLRKLFGGSAQPTFAAQLKLAISAAQASKSDKSGKVAVVFSSGDSVPWQKALTQANVERLPILFVCATKLVAEPLPQHTEPYFFPCITVDGNDVVAVYRVATEAIAHARKGNGATLIHCAIDRSEAHDPLLKMEAYLTRKGLFSLAWKRKIAAGFMRKLDAALKAGSGQMPR
jgi:TPP-dependent pyruvate/acetoin dehydrogenase alpha subunit